MKFIYLPAMFLPFLFFANINCKERGSKKKYEKSTFYFSDSVVKDLPFNKKGAINSRYYLKDEYQKLRGFHTLENGFDSLKIRICYGYALSDKEQVVEIAYEDREWSAELFTITKKYYNDTDSAIYKTEITSNDEPKSGWAKFISKIFDLGIQILPNSETIPGYKLPFDASGVSVEIATKHNYRLYFYDAPALNNHITEAIKMEEIMELIEEELGFKRVRKF
jgi:hypothetical protein